MTARSGAHTALGGSMFGVALPTALTGVGLLVGESDPWGLLGGPATDFGLLALVSASLLACAGATLLWAHHLSPIPMAASAPRAHRLELPAAVIPVRRVPVVEAEPMVFHGASTEKVFDPDTRLIAFAAAHPERAPRARA